MFENAGLDRTTPPKTWEDVEAFPKKIMDSGAAKCGFTTGWISWVQLEIFSARHNQQIGTLENGFAGLGTELTFNGPLQARHWENLARWQKESISQYGGPVGRNDAPPKFYTQECAIYMNASASRAGVIANAKEFEVGYGILPHYADTAPQNFIIVGATLWVMAGRPKAEYKAAANFFTYLSSAEVQAKWHQDTGCLPITQAAWNLSKSQGYNDANPGADVSIRQMTLNAPTPNSKGLHFDSSVQIRGIIDEEFQALLGGQKAALDALVTRGNVLLREFEAANK